MYRHGIQGFNLIEMLIAVAILGIITAMALPSYQASVIRSGRAEAKSILLQVASNQERFFSANNTYSTDADPLSNPVVTTLTFGNRPLPGDRGCLRRWHDRQLFSGYRHTTG